MDVDADSPAAVAERKQMTLADIKIQINLVEKAVKEIETRLITRALRTSANIRHHLTPAVLSEAISANVKGSFLAPSDLTRFVSSDVEMATDAPANGTVAPESEAFVAYLIVLYLHDQKEYGKGLELTRMLLEKVQTINRRFLDQIAAKFYFYFARFNEVNGNLANCRDFLLKSHRLATIRRDNESLAVLLNLLLRSYIHSNLYDQAEKLVSKSTFPEDAQNNQLARYMYYIGRIKAIQLDYTSSHQYLQQAVRKAPTSNFAAGFLQSVHKLSIIVQLLMGEIPEKSVFRMQMLKKALGPYLSITQAVRDGDLSVFQDALGKYSAVFQADKTYSLILRLRHNVIKAGIRRISQSYSRISLRDICLLLQLDSEEDAEYIVAKAIRDGVIDATINHEQAYMKSNENIDIYSSTEPQHAFHQRIDFCLKLHNESVKAMRYPNDDKSKKELAIADKILEENDRFATEIEDGTADFDDDEGDF